MTLDLLTIGIAGLAFIAIVGVGFAFAGDRGKQTKRVKAIGDGDAVRIGRRAGSDQGADGSERRIGGRQVRRQLPQEQFVKLLDAAHQRHDGPR